MSFYTLFYLPFTINSIIRYLMGNQCSQNCSNELPNSQLTAKQDSFIQNSLRSLKVHNKIPKGYKQNELAKTLMSQFNSKIYEQQHIAVSEVYNNNQKLHAVVKHNQYLYLGQYNTCIEGNGKLVISNKIFDGQFKNNKIDGHGELLLNHQLNKRKIILKGQWSDKFSGQIIVQGISYNLPFQIDKSTIGKQKNLYYIQYPNYDQYFGQIQDNLAQCQGMFIYRNNNPSRNYPIYIGNFHRGKREGFGTMYYSFRRSLQINWKDGRPNGEGSFTVNDTKLYVLYNQEGKRRQRLFSQIDQSCDQ